MPSLDQYGRTLNVGDHVIIHGTIDSLTGDPNYSNCTVKLDQLMPPSNSETKLQMNTAQLERDMTLSPEPAATQLPAQTQQAQQGYYPQYPGYPGYQAGYMTGQPGQTG
jgi:hypothetical protein